MHLAGGNRASGPSQTPRRASRRAIIERLDGRLLLSAAPSTNSITLAAVAEVAPVSLGANVNVTRSPAYEGEGTVAIDPTNTNRVFAASETDAGGIVAAYSTDAGATWTTRTIANGKDLLGRGDKNPQAAFDRFGNLYLAYLETTNGRAVRVAVSTDAGQTFSPLHAHVAPGLDQPSIAVGGDAGDGVSTVWITYRDGTGGISAAGARVTGKGTAQVGAFSSPQSVPGGTGNFGDIAVGPAGEVVVTWQTNTGGEGPASVQVATDADGLGPGAFSSPRTATSTNVGGFDFLPAQPNRAIDAEANLAYDLSTRETRGRLYLVYTDESPDEGNNFDVYVRRSLDHGASWGPAVRVNDDTTQRSQFLPEIAVDATTGKLVVGWYDAREDSGVAGEGSRDSIANNDARYWGAMSHDSGVTFLNFPVAAGESSAPAAGGLFDFGDYTAVAVHNGRAQFAWADNSTTLPGNPARPQMELATAGGRLSALDGPTVRSVTPEGAVVGAVSQIDVRFDRPMSPSSFSAAADVVSFTGPGGSDLKALLGAPQWLDGDRTLRLTFPAQSAPGNYELVFGPDIRSVANDPMDTDGDGTEGEAVADRVTHGFTIAAPRVVSHLPESPKVGTANSFDFTFNQPMDPGSFSLSDDLVSFTGPGGADLRGVVTGTSWSNGNRTLRVSFDRQGADGEYSMTIGPRVLAAAGGWALDQDGDFAAGEAGEDAYAATFTIDRSTGPDAFGYQAWTHAYQFLDLSSGGTGVSTVVDGADDGAASIPLGANAFDFYGRTYTGSNALFVSSNGVITFGGGDTGFQNGDLTEAPGRATIAPLWDDWRTDAGTDSRVLYRFDDMNGDGATDRLVVEWNAVLNANGSTTSPATFQAILRLNTDGTPGEIIFNYPDLDVGAATVNNGAGATAGVKGEGNQGDRRLLVSMNVGNGPYVGGGKAVRIATTPQPQQPPTLTSLSDIPDSVRTGAPITLTANNVIDVDGAIASVAFYRESNGTSGLQTGAGGDTLLGTDTAGAGGYTGTASTADLADGVYTYYAVATDDDAATSNVVSATGKVDNTVPTVDISNVSDPRTSPLSSITVVFSEAVKGVTVSDFTLTRNGANVTLGSGQSVSSSDGGTTWTFGGLWSITAPAADYTLRLNAAGSGITDLAGNALEDGASDSWRKNAGVVDRLTFYNQSNFDRVNVAADISDYIAIAVDKTALLPGQKASFANVTSFNRGINGVMIDIFGLVGTPGVSDFQFRVGTAGDPSTWAAGPTPLSIVRRNGDGKDDSDRLLVTFPSGSIVDKWLQVTLKATSTTGLPSQDVFYFGNLVGETGNAGAGATSLSVNALDLVATRMAQNGGPVPVTSRYDFNRDGRVSSLDMLIARSRQSRPPLSLITAPPKAPTAAAVAGTTAPGVRSAPTARSELLFGEAQIA